MPDIALPGRPPPPSTVERLRAARRPLLPRPSPAGSWRARAVAACDAEAAHGRADFWRCVHALGLAGRFDRDDPSVAWGGHEAPYLLAHEAQAAAALAWLAHLQAHEGDRRGPWAVLRWETASAAERGRWRARRRVLWAGWLEAVGRYRAARDAYDRTRARDRAP